MRVYTSALGRASIFVKNRNQTETCVECTLELNQYDDDEYDNTFNALFHSHTPTLSRFRLLFCFLRCTVWLVFVRSWGSVHYCALLYRTIAKIYLKNLRSRDADMA